MSATDKKYNGWANYETWVTKLWMDNDEGSYHYWQEAAVEVWEDSDDKDEFCSSFAARLESEHEENAPTAESGVYADLLNAALSEVDWYEIAESFVEDLPAKETEDEDEDEEGSL